VTGACRREHARVWDNFTEMWWCVCEGWTSDSVDTFAKHCRNGAECYCGMFDGECPYDIDGECHNELDATSCGGTDGSDE
jgi:N6-adenosine-specific RNA methylase IME4